MVAGDVVVRPQGAGGVKLAVPLRVRRAGHLLRERRMHPVVVDREAQELKTVPLWLKCRDSVRSWRPVRSLRTR